MRKLVALVLGACLLLGCLGTTAWARPVPVMEVQLDEPFSFTVTQEDHVVEYGYTAQEDGDVVIYDVDGGFQSSRVSVGVLDEEQQIIPIAEGISRAAFRAEAGKSYRFTLDLAWMEGSEIEYAFAISRPVAVESLSIVDATIDTGFVGQEGTVSLLYAPLNSAADILWETSDPGVVTVTGDQGGAVYQLVGPGTAVVSATTDDGIGAQFQVTVKDVDVLELGQSFQYTLEANGGKYRESEHDFAFTAVESGFYALAVSYDPALETYHDLQLSTVSQGSFVYGGDVLRFYAEAGEVCYLNAEFWGTYDQSVTYDLVVLPCVKAGGITLVPETVEGYAGDAVDVRVLWDPVNALPEALSWTTSDPSVAQVSSDHPEYASVQLLGAGVATVTAATQGGSSHSFQITVYPAPKPIALVEGLPSTVTLLGGGSVDITFVPEVSGYYRLAVGSEDMGAYLFTGSAGEDLYYLEAGQVYQGCVDNYAQVTGTAEVYILRTEVMMPVGMEITKLPDDTTYLKGSLGDMWTYQLLAGLEMEISWSDGSTSLWRFDEEGPYVGQEFLQWELLEGQEQHLRELRLTCGGAVTSCQLTVLDKSITSVELVDSTPLQVVERSCGMDMGDGTWYYATHLYDTRQLKISFSDGSHMLVLPEQKVYGLFVTCEDSQKDAPWVKGGQASVTFGYGDTMVVLPVQIIESPVERIELVKLPKDTFVIGDKAFFTGDPACYFAPKDLRAFLAGMEMVIWYQDGSSRTVTVEDLQWADRVDGLYPCVDGYPLGLFGELMTGNEMIMGPCDRGGIIEFMGASQSYTIHLVQEQVEDPPVDPTEPPTDPTTEPSEPTDPTEPSTEPPTDPTTQPTDPSEPSESQTTEPSRETEPTQTTQSDPGSDDPGADGGWIWIAVVIAVVAALAAGAAVVLLRKKKAQ